MSPAQSDGEVAAGIRSAPMASFSVTVGFQPVAPQYLGNAPGSVAGFLQLNLPVPKLDFLGSAQPATVPVFLTIPGDSAFVAGASIYVQ